MMEDTHGADHVSTWSSHDQRARDMNSQLRQENKKLQKHVERLQSLLSDIPEFEEEKTTMLEALNQSCAREQELKERMKEEERDSESLHDALMDLRDILKMDKVKQKRVETLKRSVFTTKCALEDMQFLLTCRDEALRKRNAEIEELLALQENCSEHVKETVARIEETQKATEEARERGRLRALERQTCEKEKRKETPPAPVKTVPSEERPSGLGCTLLTVYSFALTMLFLFFVISSVISAFRGEVIRDILCTDVILDRVTELVVPISTVHNIDLPLF